MTMDAQASQDGTQSIERAVTLLRVLATRARVGWALTELAAAAGLKKATAHRILARLEHEGLVHRRGIGDRYFLGALLGELSLCIPGFHDFVAQGHALVTELARKLSVVALLSIRSGDHFVMAARIGSSRLPSKLHDEGSYRPLLDTAGGIAILITLPEPEQQAILERNRAQIAQRSSAQADLCVAMWQRSRAAGYGVNFGEFAPGVNAVAVPLAGQGERAFASLTVAGREPHLDQERCRALVPMLREQAAALTDLARHVQPGLYVADEPAQ